MELLLLFCKAKSKKLTNDAISASTSFARESEDKNDKLSLTHGGDESLKSYTIKHNEAITNFNKFFNQASLGQKKIVLFQKTYFFSQTLETKYYN